MKKYLPLIIFTSLIVIGCNDESNDIPIENSFSTINKTDSLRVIELSGTNYEIGLQHGKILKNEIHELVKLWEKDIESNYGIPSDTFVVKFLRSTEYLKAIAEWTPNLLEEIKGISQGAEIDFNKMFVFQLIDEMWTNGRIVHSIHHCTSIGVANRKKGDSINYIAQNIDVTPFYHKYKVLLKIINETNKDVTYVTTFPGYIGANGLNQNIGITVNSLMDLESSLDGLPVCCVVRGVLNKHSFVEAEAFLKDVKHASGQNYIVGSKDNIASFECSASKISSYWPDSTKLYTFHANNTLTNNSYNPEYLIYLKDSLQKTHEEFISNNPRLEAMKKRFIGTEKIDLQTIKKALQSKDDLNEPICNQLTWMSTIMEFHETYNVLLISAGKPDSTDYLEFKIE